jgi:hypothetical protein
LSRVLHQNISLHLRLKIAMASVLSLLAVAAVTFAVADAQSLEVVNKCNEDVFLFTQSSFGTIDNNIMVSAGASTDMGISSNWDGAVNVGEYFVGLRQPHDF